ncbi:hypothetical protein JMA_02700 [Jeotgalibacillus malaysiensis]|uniref:Uncharacterized protein n=1 Tax=Jeotgalibacillus malaysiensis TaxID=1508404 RepID=A0A0B5ALK2_9BACL|nr:hypothetical protein [Jeotgalibacillus malaysiensis]AJD89587.1 hypothetical protein JMA_02700 [Jeotgalibacillus malaysiensis]
MNCCCEDGKIRALKLEGDVGADPVWCHQCGCNLDIEEVPISNELKQTLILWAGKYGEWIDWDKDCLIDNGIELEERFNQAGYTLLQQLKQEIGEVYSITYSASSSARHYARKYKG